MPTRSSNVRFRRYFTGCAGKPTSPASDLKSGRAYRADPVLDLSRCFFVHIKEMRHCWSHRLDARIVEFHRNLAMKDLQQRAVPILHDIVMRGKALIDKLPEVISDRLASVPVGNAEIAYGILWKVIVSTISSWIAMLRC